MNNRDALILLDPRQRNTLQCLVSFVQRLMLHYDKSHSIIKSCSAFFCSTLYHPKDKKLVCTWPGYIFELLLVSESVDEGFSEPIWTITEQMELDIKNATAAMRTPVRCTTGGLTPRRTRHFGSRSHLSGAKRRLFHKTKQQPVNVGHTQKRQRLD